jgi:hypothetical protein
MNNGHGFIAAVFLLTAGAGAEQPVPDIYGRSVIFETPVQNEQCIDIAFAETTGMTLKKYRSEAGTPDPSAVTAWSLIGINSFKLHADHLWHNYDLIKTEAVLQCMSVYFGVGGRMKLRDSNRVNRNETQVDDTRLGIRSPLGVSYVFEERSIELFAEVVPILDIIPETRFGMGVGVGARYSFSLL